MKPFSYFLEESNQNETYVITMNFNGGEVTLVCKWIDGYGSIATYLDQNMTQRAYYNRYEMKEFNDKAQFDKFVKNMKKKALKFKKL